MENCASHKTENAIAILRSLKISTIFTGPGSFEAVPIEGLFAAIKAKDFKRVEDPNPSLLGDGGIKPLTHKQILMIKVS